MAEHQFNKDWVDRYVRNKLSSEDEIAFEIALLEDQHLQAEVESTMAIRETLKRVANASQLATTSVARKMPLGSLTTWALAASVLLAIVSTGLAWRFNIDNSVMQSQIEAMQSPLTNLLRVPVDIMRSSGNNTPDVVIQKPSGRSAIVLDIELSGRFQKLDLVDFSLRREDDDLLLVWSATPDRNGYVSVMLQSETIPDGKVFLYISDVHGQLVEKRLLEFRKAAD